MFPKRKINTRPAGEAYGDGITHLEQMRIRPGEPVDAIQLSLALDAHFNAVGAMLREIALSIDMLFERIDNLERRMR